MYILNGIVKITTKAGTYEFKNPGEIKIDSTYLNMTDIATIELPSKFITAGKEVSIYDNNNTVSSGENRLFSVGDAVEIRLSYVGQHEGELDDDNSKVFTGFIREINNQAPLKIVCDDNMYLLKKTRANISVPNDSKISTIIDKLLTKGGWTSSKSNEYSIDLNGATRSIEVKYTDPNMVYGKLLVTGKPNVASVLDKLKFFKFFFKGNVLYVTLPQTSTIEERQEHSLEYETQIIKDDLFYQTDADVLFKVTAKSFVNNKEYREATVGDPEGELRTLHAPSGLTKAQLELFAQEELEKFKFTGFKASFLTFGDPIIRSLDVVEITRKKQPEQGVGRFIVDKVVTEFGFGGFRQEVYLGSKAI